MASGLADQLQILFGETSQLQIAEHGLFLVFQVIAYVTGDEGEQFHIGGRHLFGTTTGPLPGYCLEVLENQLQQ
ncbi:hypothetical protein D3C73_1635510 [compost metagenome]